jgi:hypothetical protein
VKYADEVALLTERRDFICAHPAARPWREDSSKHPVQPDPVRMFGLEPKQAERSFMAMADGLGLI